MKKRRRKKKRRKKEKKKERKEEKKKEEKKKKEVQEFNWVLLSLTVSFFQSLNLFFFIYFSSFYLFILEKKNAQAFRCRPPSTNCVPSLDSQSFPQASGFGQLCFKENCEQIPEASGVGDAIESAAQPRKTTCDQRRKGGPPDVPCLNTPDDFST